METIFISMGTSITHIEIMKDVAKDLLFGDIGLAIVFIQMRTGVNDPIHIQVEIIEIRQLDVRRRTENPRVDRSVRNSTGTYFIVINHSTNIRVSF